MGWQMNVHHSQDGLSCAGHLFLQIWNFVCFQHFGNRSWQQVKRCRRFASAKTNVLTNAQISTGDKSKLLRVHAIFSFV